MNTLNFDFEISEKESSEGELEFPRNSELQPWTNSLHPN